MKTALLKTVRTSLLIMVIILLVTPGTYANIRLISNLTHEYRALPGEKYSGKLVIANNGSETAVVKLYLKDYRFDAEGHTYFLQPGTIKRSNADWIKLSKNIISIPGKACKKIYYNVEIPCNNQITGTYWSMLMVEPHCGEAQKPLSVNKDYMIGINQNFRYGIQIVADATNTAKNNLKFENPRITKKDEHYIFEVDFINKGERWLTPEVWLDIYNNKGEKINRYYGRKLRIYPTTSVCQQIELDNIKPGSYKTVLIADNGDNAVFGSRYDLEIAKK